MQTPQVSNVANVLAAPAPPSKSGEASSSAPFEQVLSREVADRSSAKEANADKSHAAKPVAENQKKADADSTAPSDAADSADSSDSVEDANATAQASEDMLALVANLAQLAAAGEKKTDPLAAAAALNTRDGSAAAAQSATRKTGAALHALTDKAIAQQQQDDTLSAAAAAKEARAGAMLADQAGKAALSSGVAVAGAATPDFSAAMKESASSLGAANQQLQGVQPGAVQSAQQLAANAAEKLTPRVGTPAWDQALGQKVVWMVAGEQHSASLTLNPPDLGPLQVALSVSNSQATATFSAAQPEVRQALEAALPKLREMLGEAGIQLGHASVNSGAQNQQGGEQQAAQHGRRVGLLEDGSEAQVHVSRVPVPAAGRGMVDTFV